MAHYRVVVTAQLDRPLAVDRGRVKAVTGGSVRMLSPDVVQVAMMRRESDPFCAVERAVLSLQRGLGPAASFTRPPAWSARRARLPIRGRALTGRWPLDGDGDDGSAGVREPRRPIPPHGAASAALDLPT